ncbi:MAG: cation:proton antiporter [Nitrospirota bacterium]|nr:cation:proton antiporter [Nitrospirota bacterium]
MDEISKILITLGTLFLLGLFTDLLGRRTFLPRVTLLLLTGFAIGPSGLNLLPDFQEEWFPVVTNIALSMVGFLLGHHMTRSSLQRHGKIVLWISIGAVLATAMTVFIGLLLLGIRPDIALVLAGISLATDPAATIDVIREIRAKGEFSSTLENIVAIDDVWGLMIFSVLLAMAQTLYGQETGWDMLLLGGWEIGGAMLLGLVLGIPMAYLTGRIKQGEPTQAEALGLVLLCGGIAVFLNVSFILACMVLGATVANFAAHHRRPFTAIEGIEWPFMILFFILAGASLDLNALRATSLLGVAYILLRLIGRVIGAWGGGILSGASPVIRRWMGMALWPQAGVALGMALLASQHLPELKEVILPVAIGSTIVFELIGPVMTRKALIKAGEGQTHNEIQT